MQNAFDFDLFYGIFTLLYQNIYSNTFDANKLVVLRVLGNIYGTYCIIGKFTMPI